MLAHAMRRRAGRGYPVTNQGRQGMPVKWIKSSFSAYNGSCVEVALLPSGHIGMRHSKHPHDAVLTFTRAEWEAFLLGTEAGEFDDLTREVT